MAEQRWLDDAGAAGTAAGGATPRSTLWRMVAAVFDIDLDERARRHRAQGEEEVAQRLSHLPAEWHVVHDLPLDDGADAEHVVVGPAGVFVVEPLVHGGRVTVTDRAVSQRGANIHWMHKSLRKARKVELALVEVLGAQVEVRPVLAVVGARLDRHDHLDGVGVVRSRKLADWLTGHERLLTPDAVVRVAAAADLVRSGPAETAAPRGNEDLPTSSPRRHLDDLAGRRTVA